MFIQFNEYLNLKQAISACRSKNPSALKEHSASKNAQCAQQVFACGAAFNG